MSDSNIERLRRRLQKLEKDPQNSVKAHLIETSEQHHDRIICKFYLVSCIDEEVREQDFIDFLLVSIIRYVHKRQKYTSKQISNPNYIGRLFMEARDKFIENIRVRSGEMGELILFVLLESQGIFQLVNKMDLKTAKNMHVHGSDLVLIQVESSKVILHFGESKMHADISDGVSAFVDSLEGFTDRQTGKQRFEINVVSTHIDESKFAGSSDLILDFIDPFAQNKENLRIVNSVFLGYDWNILCNLTLRPASMNLTSYLNTEYPKTYEKIIASVKAAIKKSSIANQNFRIHMIPFRNVLEFHDLFMRRL